ncbi:MULTISPECIES: penicillin-binding protein 1A [Candidatus Ichthyocystis]|uniref:peptidoglycan glycosyltransferase n=1 Tax=Candidatus Ichthyocystis hellenicum TaxID=1561003 RepID=A0A0S4M234_9BURK|nr:MULTISPECIES: PBP1A family penicillin-binding protein [Ichthyocystis]CUT17339.1 putative penicillin-binding protein 1A [Candidatus Ichthyocystis hellenicum]
MKLLSALTTFVSCIVGISIALLLSFAIMVTVASKQLPSLDTLKNSSPEIPLRIFTADGSLIAEYGIKKRDIVPINRVPLLLRKAILAAEDDRFYKHPGVDLQGIIRAIVLNIEGKRLQGASTITMQVAKNFFFSPQRTYKRKFYEMLMAFNIDATLGKDQILELYINKIFLGNHSYGFAAAAEAYFGKTLNQLNLAEMALLAGLPKAPSTYNPITNLQRATVRQKYVLGRMLDLRYISPKQYMNALRQTIIISPYEQKYAVTANYVAEMARQFLYSEYGKDAYQKGFNVYTTISKNYQKIANQSLRHNLIEYTERHNFPGISGKINPGFSVKKQLAPFHNYAPLISAVVEKITDTSVSLLTRKGKKIEIIDAELERLQDDSNHFIVKRGDILYVRNIGNNTWRATGLPKVEGALVSENVYNGAIIALCGGFSESASAFNHVTQAWRQPGSSIKPMIYSAALAEGYTPETMIDDSPISFTAKETGSTAWTPRNFDKIFKGFIPVWQALAESRNVPSVRVLQFVGISKAKNMLEKFGLDSKKQPPYLTLVLGAGLATPWQMLQAYSIFARNGIKIKPYLIERITDFDKKVIFDAEQNIPAVEEVLSTKVSQYIDYMLRKVITDGTGKRALSIGRDDVAGKTGTTNDSIDAWFCGYAGNVATVTWVGFDSPQPLGKHEYGSQTALPIWIEYTKKALNERKLEGEKSFPTVVLNNPTEA